MVRRSLATSREQAQQLIDAGVVRINGAVADKAARQVEPGAAVVVVDVPRFVGRGALKLLAAIDEFAIDPAGLRCLDVGASTGGFTDVLLQAGAAHVVALDVGHGQMHERISADHRVTVVERTNMRHVARGDLGSDFSLVVVDVSFISLRTLMPALAAQLNGILVALIKPQFEVGRKQASRGKGVITDPELWRQAIEGVAGEAADQGLSLRGLVASPITGGDGNVEFLARLERTETAPDVGVTVAQQIDDVMEKLRAVVPDDLP